MNLKIYSKKKRIIIIGCVLLLCCAYILIYLCTQPKLVTGQKSELQQVTIVEAPYYGGKNLETIITNEETMNTIYNAIAYLPTSTNRYPNHSDSLQFDSDYEVIFIFKDTKDEVIIHGEKAYRFLETHGASGDSGFTCGNATRILDRIMAVKRGDCNLIAP